MIHYTTEKRNILGRSHCYLSYHSLEPLLIWSQVYFRNLFQLSLGHTRGEVTHVVVLWGDPENV